MIRGGEFKFVGKISAGRKNKRATSEQMQMKMKNRLPAVAVRIDNDAITVVGKAFFTGYTGGSQKQMSKRFSMTAFGFVERRKMLARNY